VTTTPTLIKNFEAGTGGVRDNRVVQFGAADGVVIEATASTQLLLGVSTQPGTAAAGERCDVVLSGIADVIAGGSITRGSYVTTDNAGRVVAAAPAAGVNAAIVGMAMQSAATNDIIQVLLAQGRIQG
jgi:hypothetical protein